MLLGNILTVVWRELDNNDGEDVQALLPHLGALDLNALDAQATEGDRANAHIALSSLKRGSYSCSIRRLMLIRSISSVTQAQ